MLIPVFRFYLLLVTGIRTRDFECLKVHLHEIFCSSFLHLSNTYRPNNKANPRQFAANPRRERRLPSSTLTSDQPPAPPPPPCWGWGREQGRSTVNLPGPPPSHLPHPWGSRPASRAGYTPADPPHSPPFRLARLYLPQTTACCPSSHSCRLHGAL
jgi:hypothetical protein